MSNDGDTGMLSYRTAHKGVAGIAEGKSGQCLATVQEDGVSSYEDQPNVSCDSWPLGVSPGNNSPHFLTPAIACSAGQFLAAAVSTASPSRTPANHSTNSSSSKHRSTTGAEVWLWTRASAGASITRNAKRKQLPSGAVHSIHPVDTTPDVGSPGPVEIERQHAAAADSLAKLCGLSTAHPMLLESSDEASSQQNLSSSPDSASCAVVFCDGKVVYISLAADDDIPSLTSVPAPKTGGDPAVLAAAHCRECFVTVTAASDGSSDVSVAMYTAQVKSQPRQPLRVQTFSIAGPAPSAAVCQVAVFADRLAMLWDNGYMHVCRLSLACKSSPKTAFQLGVNTVGLQLNGFSIKQLPGGRPVAAEQPMVTPKKRRKAADNGTAELVTTSPAVAAHVGALSMSSAPAIVLLPHDHAAIVGWHSGDTLQMTVLELLYGSVQSVTRAQCSSSSVSKQQLQGVALSTSSIAVLARGQLLMVSIQVAPVTLASVVGALSIDARFPASDATAQQLAARSALRPESLSTRLPEPDHRPFWRGLSAAYTAREAPLSEVPVMHKTCSSDSASQQISIPQPDATAGFLSSLAFSSSSNKLTISSEEAEEAVVAAAAFGGVHISAIGEAATLCAERGHWSAIAQMIESGMLSSARVAPALLSTLAVSGQLRLCGNLLVRGGDTSTHETLRLLQLCLPSHDSPPGSQTPALQKAQCALHAQLSASALAAVEAAEQDMTRNSARLYAAAASSAIVEPFPPNELLLHPLVASSTRDEVVSEAARQLDAHQAIALLSYLAAWLTHHSRLLAGWMHPVDVQWASSDSSPHSASKNSDGPVTASGNSQKGGARHRSHLRNSSSNTEPHVVHKQVSRQQQQRPQHMAAKAACNSGAGPMLTGTALETAPSSRNSNLRSSNKDNAWWPVPPLERVLAWSCAVLGAHLVTLQPNKTTKTVLEEIHIAVTAQMAETTALVRCRGVVEHLRAGRPLPASPDAQMMYTVEHIDMSTL